MYGLPCNAAGHAALSGRRKPRARPDLTLTKCDRLWRLGTYLVVDGAPTVVIAVDPMETVAAKSDALRPIAEEVRSRLGRVLERLT